MKRKVECFYYDEKYDNIINDINTTMIYLNINSENDIKTQSLSRYTHIINMRNKFQEYINNLNHDVIFNIKHELDLFFLLISKNQFKQYDEINTDILLKLILKIDNLVISNHKK
jgi:hypothetical protein